MVYCMRRKIGVLAPTLTSRNTNEITELPETMNPEPYTFKNGEYAIRIEEGRPFGSFYGYRYKGVYQNQEATYARDKEGMS